jgi:hypothetical protein
MHDPAGTLPVVGVPTFLWARAKTLKILAAASKVCGGSERPAMVPQPWRGCLRGAVGEGGDLRCANEKHFANQVERT